MKIMGPYLRFDSETEEAFHFYKSVFGGEFKNAQRFKDIPAADREQGGIKESEGGKIMHIALPIGQVVLMGSDAPESIPKARKGNSIYIAIEAESKEEAQKLFQSLSEGGNVQMPMMDMFWGAYYGMFQDKFGVGWMINYSYPKK